LEKGYIQIYTGNGKGKTTAALGLIMRALGSGMNIFLCQFMKNNDTGELNILKQFEKQIDVIQCGLGKFCTNRDNPGQDHIDAAQAGFQEAKEAIDSGRYDLIVLDEINVAVYYNLISVEDLISLLKNKPEKTELILTGRYAEQKIYEYADLITEMKEIKHYYKIGVQQRKGIEY
jgi:cob(I)alamin adenosyltransferase